MSGEITEFRGGGAPEQISGGSPGQIERIEALLGELEELSQGTIDLASSLVDRLHATLEKAHSVLKHCGPLAEEEEDEENDPQPDIDGDILERMYRRLEGRPLSMR